MYRFTPGHRALAVLAATTLALACSPEPEPVAGESARVQQWRSPSGTATLSPASVHWTEDPQTGSIDVVGARLEDLMTLAYGLDNARAIEFQLEIPRLPAYDAVVRPEDGRLETAHRLLRELLEESFSFRTERESREVPALILRRLEGPPVLTPSAAPARAVDAKWGRFEATRAPLSELASFLELRSARPVVDQTGLSGEYDFVLEWDPDGGENALLLAMNDLGLALIDGTGTQDVLIVRARD